MSPLNQNLGQVIGLRCCICNPFPRDRSEVKFPQTHALSQRSRYSNENQVTKKKKKRKSGDQEKGEWGSNHNGHYTLNFAFQSSLGSTFWNPYSSLSHTTSESDPRSQGGFRINNILEINLFHDLISPYFTTYICNVLYLSSLRWNNFKYLIQYSNNLSSLCLIFLICKMGIIIVLIYGISEESKLNVLIHIKHWNTPECRKHSINVHYLFVIFILLFFSSSNTVSIDIWICDNIQVHSWCDSIRDNYSSYIYPLGISSFYYLKAYIYIILSQSKYSPANFVSLETYKLK